MCAGIATSGNVELLAGRESVKPDLIGVVEVITGFKDFIRRFVHRYLVCMSGKILSCRWVGPEQIGCKMYIPKILA